MTPVVEKTSGVKPEGRFLHLNDSCIIMEYFFTLVSPDSVFQSLRDVCGCKAIKDSDVSEYFIEVTPHTWGRNIQTGTETSNGQENTISEKAIDIKSDFFLKGQGTRKLNIRAALYLRVTF